MPHFSRSALEADDLARLQEILHGRSVKTREGKVADRSSRKPARAVPTIEERFGIASGNHPTSPRCGLAVIDGSAR